MHLDKPLVPMQLVQYKQLTSIVKLASLLHLILPTSNPLYIHI